MSKKKKIKNLRHAILPALLLLAICIGSAKSGMAQNDALPSRAVPSGKAMYFGYCSVCHGDEAKGDGPYASMLKMPPANLSTLAKRHEGKFPYDYVSNVLRFGPGNAILHGSPDMPAWGPIFQWFDKNNERVVEQRIKNLCNYLASLQEK
jgi:mono/diheme cytochrome c family protein